MKELDLLLEKFSIDKSILPKGDLITQYNNIFLSTSFLRDQIYKDILLFIRLRDKLLPSKFLLELISNHTQNKLTVSTKRSLDVTYGKSISVDSLTSKVPIHEGQYYLLLAQDETILGIGEKEEKKRINIVMHIGEYLRE